MSDREVMYLVVENKEPKQEGNWLVCGAAYGIFPTRESAEEYQKRQGLQTTTHIDVV